MRVAISRMSAEQLGRRAMSSFWLMCSGSGFLLLGTLASLGLVDKRAVFPFSLVGVFVVGFLCSLGGLCAFKHYRSCAHRASIAAWRKQYEADMALMKRELYD